MDAQLSERTRWRAVLLVFGAGVVVAFQIGKVPAAIPTLRAELGLGLFAAGWVISIFNVIGVGLGMLAGVAADRMGHRRIVLAGLGCVALASFAGGFAPGAATILAARFVEGLGFIAVIVAAPALIVAATRPEDLRLAFGVWGGYMPAGTATMILLSPLVLEPFGWRGLWLANGGIVTLFALCLWAGTREVAGGDRRPRTDGAPFRDMLRTLTARGPLLLAATFSTYTANFIAVLGFLPTFLVEQRGLAGPAAAALPAFAIDVNVPGNLVGGWLLHRGAPRWLLILAASLTMAAASLGIYSDSVPDAARYGLCLAFSFVGGILPTAILGAAPSFAPAPRLLATTNGLIMQGANLGQMVGPPTLAALVSLAGGWQAAPTFVVASALVGAGLALAIRHLEAGVRIPDPLP